MYIQKYQPWLGSTEVDRHQMNNNVKLANHKFFFIQVAKI